ncbi:MAG: 2'-5' RNA ligase family protein [Balneolaceae bacterium]|nr:2'-5' RNA ligase family protein [Balneolaceae bacterium]
MYYALVHFPDIEIGPIQRFRKKYDPSFNLVEPHITVVFPVPDQVGRPVLERHIKLVLDDWQPFDIEISGTRRSWDHWLLLTLKGGNENVIQLNRDLYTGILAPFRRDDLGFIPHLGVGLFVKDGDYNFKDPKALDLDRNAFDKARKEAEALDMPYHSAFNRLDLLELNNEMSDLNKVKTYPL